MNFGLVNWDAALPAGTYFGDAASKSLSAPQFYCRVPYYASVRDGKVVFPKRTQEDFDRELTYAIHAGIDYFAYVRYTFDEKLENPTDEVERTAGWCELNTACQLHRSSKLRDRIGYCLIIRPSKMNERDFQMLPDELTADGYVKIDGRPLVYVYGGQEKDGVIGRKKLKKYMADAGKAEPYVVPMTAHNGIDYQTASDATGRYAVCKSGITEYIQLGETIVAQAKQMAALDLPTIPNFSTGWNPSPRILSPVPWTKYGYTPADYAADAKSGDFAKNLDALIAYMRTEPDKFPTDHILTFAWNEFEEGGWLCPTLGKDGKPDTSRLDEFAKAIAKYKD